MRAQKSGFAVLCSMTLALGLLRRLAFGRLIIGRRGRFLRYGMHVHGNGANCCERELVDPGGALAVAPVINRFVQRLVIAAEQPIVIDQAWRAIVGNSAAVARMAVV